MFRNEKFLGIVHPYNLLEYFQNKETESNKTLLKRPYANGSINQQQFLNSGSNKLYCSRTEKRKKVPVCEMLRSSTFLSSFIMETEER